MRTTTRMLITVGTLTLLPLTVAFSCDAQPKVPRTGKITEITPGSAACWDEQSDVAPRRSVAISYRPAGTDANGHEWPLAFTCVTPDTAAKYTVGGTYP